MSMRRQNYALAVSIFLLSGCLATDPAAPFLGPSLPPQADAGR
jgi:hypothetical protein